MSNYDSKKLQAFVNEVFDKSAVPSLEEYIKIPNTSRNFDVDWAKNGLLEKAAEHIKTWVEKLEIKGLKC